MIFAAILAAIIVADVLLPDFNILNTVDNSIKAVPESETMNPDITIEIPPTFETVFEGNIRFWIYGVAFIVTLIGYYNHVWKNRSSPSAVLAGIGKISSAS
ncbi:hypothetical protein OH491_27630 (plasmid) [Termitidicoccus mucosus]|uniref:hypothetical protein n=1 Tax=Termitidicoccus mucosus TaxID=1184151 RepID=UPI0031844A0A